MPTRRSCFPGGGALVGAVAISALNCASRSGASSEACPCATGRIRRSALRRVMFWSPQQPFAWCFPRHGLGRPGFLDAAGQPPAVICQHWRPATNASFRECMKEAAACRRTARDEARDDLFGMDNRRAVRGVHRKADSETLFRREHQIFKGALYPIPAVDERRSTAIVKRTGGGNRTKCACDADKEVRQLD